MNALTHVLVVAAVAGFAVCLVARFWRPIAATLDRFLALKPLEKAVFVLAVTVATVCAQKPSTNAPPPGMMSGAPPPGVMCGTPEPSALPVTVTPVEIARGWRMTEVRTNEAVGYAMPDEAELCMNWWRRGAYEDVTRIDIGNRGFILGGGFYTSLWAHTWGVLRPHLRDASNEIVAVGAPMSAVPCVSRFWTGCGGDGARLITWENLFLGRDTNTPVNAQVELGYEAFFVRSNEIERVYRRIDPDDWDGDDVPNAWDPNPYQSGDPLGQSDSERERIADIVGFGEENGYYRLTATLDYDQDRAVLLSVGTNTMVVKDAGEYHFLLEKGIEYSLDVTPFTSAVSFWAEDDVWPFDWMMFGSIWDGTAAWTIDGGYLELVEPLLGRVGRILWHPEFYGSPDPVHLGPSDGPHVFTANWSDYRYAEAAMYQWECDDPHVVIVSPHSRTTEIRIDEMPSWRSTTLYVTAQTDAGTYYSEVSGVSYGTNETPQVNFTLTLPNAVLLNSNECSRTKLRRMEISCSPDVEMSGTVWLECVSGSEKIALWSDQDKTSAVSADDCWDVNGSMSFVSYVEGVETSDELDDVSFIAEFVPDDGGDATSVEASLTVIEVGDVSLPGAPEDGLVILQGTSVGLKVDCLPEGAGSRLSTIWQTRRLRGNGTYDEWGYAVGNYHGNTAIYLPPAGGIYQVRVLAGVGEGGGTDVRQYVWTADEVFGLGLKEIGELRAFGVADCAWQITLRNCASGRFADSSYGKLRELSGLFGFSSLPAGTWKCNMFVAHRLRECGLPVPVLHSYRFCDLPPLANEWAGDAVIDGWSRVSNSAYVQPGWIVAHHGPPRESGHVGIVDFDGAGIAAGFGFVNRAAPEFVSGPCVYSKLSLQEENSDAL